MRAGTEEEDPVGQDRPRRQHQPMSQRIRGKLQEYGHSRLDGDGAAEKPYGLAHQPTRAATKLGEGRSVLQGGIERSKASVKRGLHLHEDPGEARDGREPRDGRSSGVERRRLAVDQEPGDELVYPQRSVEREPGPGERRVVAKRGQERRSLVRIFRQRPEDAHEQDHQREGLTGNQPEEVSRHA